ncbi:MAG TPA: hypothetical protein EYQ20_20725 [candidate division Zixibacteria bacterium]|nr:hypothetical protein [candidate division Zixibacteria bacterium]
MVKRLVFQRVAVEGFYGFSDFVDHRLGRRADRAALQEGGFGIKVELIPAYRRPELIIVGFHIGGCAGIVHSGLPIVINGYCSKGE